MCYEMEESIRRVIVPYQFATSLHHSVYIHPCAVVSHSLLQLLYQAQDTGHPSEQSANTQQQGERRNRNVLQMSIAIITVFVFCWSPLSINFLIILYQHSSITHFSCSFWIYYEVTIFICFMISSNYRKALKGRGEGNSIVFQLSFLFGLYFNTIFSSWPFFSLFLLLTVLACWSCTWINVYFKLKSGVLSWKRDLKALDLHTGQAYDQRNTISCQEMSLL